MLSSDEAVVAGKYLHEETPRDHHPGCSEEWKRMEGGLNSIDAIELKPTHHGW